MLMALADHLAESCVEILQERLDNDYMINEAYHGLRRTLVYDTARGRTLVGA